MGVQGGRPWESEVRGRGSPRWEAMGVRGERPWESEVGGHGSPR